MNSASIDSSCDPHWQSIQETARRRLQSGGAMAMVEFLLKAPPPADEASNLQRPRRRRTFSELERDFVCPHEGCQRCYASKHALQQHLRLKHGARQLEAVPKKATHSARRDLEKLSGSSTSHVFSSRTSGSRPPMFPLAADHTPRSLFASPPSSPDTDSVDFSAGSFSSDQLLESSLLDQYATWAQTPGPYTPVKMEYDYPMDVYHWSTAPIAPEFQMPDSSVIDLLTMELQDLINSV